jgi:DNA-binding MarR family transcriptional regulator
VSILCARYIWAVEHRQSEAISTVGASLDQAVDLTARHLSDRADLSASAAFVLNRIRGDGPTRLTVLAAKEGVSQPSMTQLIQRLERQDLVTRLADPEDGRAALVTITDAGEELIAERTQTRRKRLAALLDTLSDEDRTTLWLASQVALPILQRLGDNAAAAGGTESAGATRQGTRT